MPIRLKTYVPSAVLTGYSTTIPDATENEPGVMTGSTVKKLIESQPPATTTTLGTTKLNETPANPASPVAVNLNANGGIIIDAPTAGDTIAAKGFGAGTAIAGAGDVAGNGQGVAGLGGGGGNGIGVHGTGGAAGGIGVLGEAQSGTFAGGRFTSAAGPGAQAFAGPGQNGGEFTGGVGGMGAVLVPGAAVVPNYNLAADLRGPGDSISPDTFITGRTAGFLELNGHQSIVGSGAPILKRVICAKNVCAAWGTFKGNGGTTYTKLDDFNTASYSNQAAPFVTLAIPMADTNYIVIAQCITGPQFLVSTLGSANKQTTGFFLSAIDLAGVGVDMRTNGLEWSFMVMGKQVTTSN